MGYRKAAEIYPWSWSDCPLVLFLRLLELGWSDNLSEEKVGNVGMAEFTKAETHPGTALKTIQPDAPDSCSGCACCW